MTAVFDGHNDALTRDDHARLASGRDGGCWDPPADEPKIAMFAGFSILVAAFHTAIASSIAAGYGKSGGMR